MRVELVSLKEICLLKTRCRSIYGVAVIIVYWDGFVVSRFCLEFGESEQQFQYDPSFVILLVKKTGAEFRS